MQGDDAIDWRWMRDWIRVDVSPLRVPVGAYAAAGLSHRSPSRLRTYLASREQPDELDANAANTQITLKYTNKKQSSLQLYARVLSN